MSLDAATQTEVVASIAAVDTKFRRAMQGDKPSVFTDIFDDDTNIAIWHRDVSEGLKNAVGDFLVAQPTFQTELIVSPQNTLASVRDFLDADGSMVLAEDIAELVDMFCCLFGLEHAGLRLKTLDRAMCPRFHVDRVPCRLVTTYQGVATQWLPHQVVDRTKLGQGSNGLPDDESGLFQDDDDIQQLRSGDVALLKGESWEGNENAGLVHRSPEPPIGENRLLLTLDFIN